MEKLLFEQKTDLEELAAIKTNHKKWKKSSQTQKYSESKLEDISELYRRIRERDL